MDQNPLATSPIDGTVRTAPRPILIRAWLAVAACVSLILWLSSDSFSASATSGLLGRLLDLLIPDLDARTLASLHFLVRKSAHVAEYALLGVLAFRALWLSLGTRLLPAGALALGLVLAVAAVDESRQARSAVRTGSALDVALDGSGGLAAVGLAVAHRRWRRGRREILPPAQPSRLSPS